MIFDQKPLIPLSQGNSMYLLNYLSIYLATVEQIFRNVYSYSIILIIVFKYLTYIFGFQKFEENSAFTGTCTLELLFSQELYFILDTYMLSLFPDVVKSF